MNLYILLILEFLFPIKRFGDDFGESFIRKDAHCFLQLRVKLRVFKAVLKRHLVVVYADWWGHALLMGWFFESEILVVMAFMVRKKSITSLNFTETNLSETPYLSSGGHDNFSVYMHTMFVS